MWTPYQEHEHEVLSTIQFLLSWRELVMVSEDDAACPLGLKGIIRSRFTSTTIMAGVISQWLGL